ncbi:monocarboxylate transporter [Plakobranchus ocellatus]|uniref:Monocarboxylate transporter n=1 Tax=Plakobranchus ocellatus TaxID=259542 RepID=A0AAV4DSA8_9GAST|nr:monocarboxylate transporter [Plakobranchus ocellatus]
MVSGFVTCSYPSTKMAEAEGGWGWMIVFSCFMFHIICPGAFFSLSVYYPSWVEDFNASRGITSWVIGMALAVTFGSGPFLSSLVSRFGHRRVVIAGAIISSAAFFASCFAPSVYVLIALISVLGGVILVTTTTTTSTNQLYHNSFTMVPLSNSNTNGYGDNDDDGNVNVDDSGFVDSYGTPTLTTVPTPTAVCSTENKTLGFGLGMQYFPNIAIIPLYFKKRRSFAMGIAVSGLGVGAFVYPPFLTWLEEQYNWRGAMLIISGLILNVILCAAVLRPYKPQNQSSAVEDKAQTTNTPASTDSSSVTQSFSESKDSATDSDSSSTSCVSSENKEKETRPDESTLENNNLLLKSNQQLIEYDRGKVGETPILDIRKTENWSTLSTEMFTKSEKSKNVSDLFILPSRNSKAVTSDISYTDLGFSPGKLYLWQKRTTLTNQTQGDISVTGDNLRFLKDENFEEALEKEVSNSFVLKDIKGTQIPSKTSEVRPNTQPTVIAPESVTSQTSSEIAQPTTSSEIAQPTVIPTESVTSQTSSEIAQPTVIPTESVTSQTSSQTSSQISQESPTSICCKGNRLKLFANTLSILKNPCFTVYAVSNLLASMTFLMPPVYIVDRAIELGVEKRQAALALSMVGAGNLLGRLLAGLLADYIFDNLVWNGICLVLSGVATCLSPLCGSNAVLHGVYGFAFGLFIGGHMTLFPVIVIDLLGLSLLNDGFGILTLFRAVGTAAGTPIAGWIYDASNSYTASFIIHGGLVAFSGLILIPVKLALVRSKRRSENVAAAAAFGNAAVVVDEAAAAATFDNAAVVIDDDADAADNDAVDCVVVYTRPEHACETDKTTGGKDSSLNVISDVLY